MNRSAFPVPIMVLGAALALVAVLTMRGSPDQAKPAQPAAKDDQPEVEPTGGPVPSIDSARGPLTPLRAFLDVQAVDKDDQDFKTKLEPYKKGVTCIIAAIPHPTKSGLGYWYDLTLDAIERAVESADYMPDRAWTPASWRSTAAKPSKKPTPGKADRGDPPGLLLFRGKDESTKQLCLVWLVGESPTTGIDKDAMRSALKIIKDYDLGDPNGVRILGPYFSGSQSSFIETLSETLRAREAGAANGPFSLRIRNGSATAVRAESFAALGEGRPWVHLDYRTTVIPNSIMRRQVYQYLDNPSYPDKGKSPSHVAVLCEADTGFGSEEMVGRIAPEQVVIPFPIHISELQGAHNKALSDQLAQLGIPRNSGPSIPQEEGEREGEARTLVPAQSPLTTAALNDLIMKNATASLQRAGVKHVELIATDPRDKILLATLVRESCPDVQLFTTEGDFMLAHPDFNVALRGTIIGSTYPMDAQALSLPPYNQMKATRELRLLFDNQNFQGYYNAVLSLLDEGDGRRTEQMLGYGPVQCDAAREYPSIWISVIAQNGAVVPVYKVPIGQDLQTLFVDNNVLARDRSKLAAQPVGFAADESGYTINSHFSTLTLCGLFLVSGWICWFLFRGLAAYTAADELPPAQLVSPHNKSVRRLCLSCICVYTACMYGWLFALALMVNSTNPADFSRGMTINRLVLAISGGMCLVIAWFFKSRCLTPAWRMFWDPDPTQKSRLLSRAGELLGHVLGAAFFLAVFSWMVVNGFLFSSPENKALYFDRVTHFASGLSPLLPAGLLLICLLTWLYFYLRKLHSLQYHSVANPFVFAPPMHVYAKLYEFGSRLERTVQPFFLRTPTAVPPRCPAEAAETTRRIPFLRQWLVVVLPVLVIAPLFAQLQAHWIATIDGWLFDCLIFLGLFLGALATIYAALHFYAVWSRLRDLLKEVAKLPLAKAFSRLPDTVRAIVDKAFYANRPGHSGLDLARQQLQMLSVTLPGEALRKDWPQLEQAELQRLDAVLQEARALPETSADLPASDLENMDGLLRDTFSALLPLLHFFWQYRSLPEKYAVPRGKPAAGEAAKMTARAEGGDVADPIRVWLDCAEDFVAVEITRYLSQFFAQLRNILNALVLGAFLLVLSITVYPFHPQSLLLLYMVLLLGSVAALAVWVLIAINRDEVMSHLAGSTPNRFTPDVTFFKEMVQYIAPIVGLLAVQFPVVGSFVRSILEPLLGVLR